MDNDLINNCRNSVGSGGFGLGKDNPISLHTKDTSVYRTTGYGQIADIINTGYVKPKGYGNRAKRVGDIIYWSSGGDKLFYYNKKPVLEVSSEKLTDGQIGAISIDALEAVWIFNNNLEQYENKIDILKKLNIIVNKEHASISKEEVELYFNRNNNEILNESKRSIR